MLLQRFLYYLNPANLFRRPEGNVNLRVMHGINRISIVLFLACLVVVLLRAVLH